MHDARVSARPSLPPLPPLVIVHADDALVAIDKPAGLLSVPGRGADKADCAALRVQAQFPDAQTVHRLDMATSGLLLFARGATMQRAISVMFESREVHKHYEAVVHGLVEQDIGEIDLPLPADRPQRPRQKVYRPQGKPSPKPHRLPDPEPPRPAARLHRLRCESLRASWACQLKKSKAVAPKAASRRLMCRLSPKP